MKRFGTILLTLLLSYVAFCPIQAQSNTGATLNAETGDKRPKIAVVLAGGGAKGMAHVTVLEAIEDAGIPVDIVVGTSMGSIIGGLYAAGYSPEVMRQIISNTDWMQLILDNPDYGTGMLSSRLNMETYALRIKMERARKASKTGYGGLLEGENVLKLLDNLFADIPDSVDYNQLPIPFACVCTDLQTGDAKVMHSGNLATSIRTSMAIPSVFTPMIVDDRSYVDGGISNNFPVDVAKQMGADIVIGVNMARELKYENLSNNALEVLMQVMNLNGQEKTKENIQNSDIYIPIDVNGYSAASFGSEAIDSLFQRGRQAMIPMQNELKKLHDQLNITDYPDRIRVGEFHYDKNNHIVITSTSSEDDEDYQEIAQKELTQLTRVFRSKHNNLKSALGLGIRFDSYEYASLLVGWDFVLNKKHNLDLNVKARLGNRMVFSGDLSAHVIGSIRAGIKYQYKHMNLDDRYSNYKNQRASNYDYNENLTIAYLTREWQYFSWKCGIAYADTRSNNAIAVYSSQNYNEKEHSLIPFLKLRFNNYNHQYFPTSGTNLELGLKWFTNNLYQDTNDWGTDIYDLDDPDAKSEGSKGIRFSSDALFKLHLDYQSALTLGHHFTIEPHVRSNLYLNGGGFTDFSLASTMYSGLGSGIQFEDQLAFCGYNKMQNTVYDLVEGGVTLQQMIKKKHYIQATIDTVKEFTINPNDHSIETASKITGLSLSYNMMAATGPISVEGKWNDNTHRFYVFFNMGYYF